MSSLYWRQPAVGLLFRANGTVTYAYGIEQAEDSKLNGETSEADLLWTDTVLSGSGTPLPNETRTFASFDALLGRTA